MSDDIIPEVGCIPRSCALPAMATSAPDVKYGVMTRHAAAAARRETSLEGDEHKEVATAGNVLTHRSDNVCELLLLLPEHCGLDVMVCTYVVHPMPYHFLHVYLPVAHVSIGSSRCL